MISFRVIVLKILVDNESEHVFREKHKSIEALMLDRFDESFGKGIKVGRAPW